jgi:hypothetical protein
MASKWGQQFPWFNEAQRIIWKKDSLDNSSRLGRNDAADIVAQGPMLVSTGYVGVGDFVSTPLSVLFRIARLF